MTYHNATIQSNVCPVMLNCFQNPPTRNQRPNAINTTAMMAEVQSIPPIISSSCILSIFIVFFAIAHLLLTMAVIDGGRNWFFIYAWGSLSPFSLVFFSQKPFHSGRKAPR